MRIGFDVDGVLCKNPSTSSLEGCRRAEPRDIDVPSGRHEVYIITARGRHMRGVTEDWLDENGIGYAELYLYDGPSHLFDELSEGAINDAQSVFKASVIKRLGLDVFVEDRGSVREQLEKACPDCRIISPGKFGETGSTFLATVKSK